MDKIIQQISSFMSNRSSMRTLVIILAAIVVFITTYMLILPAITLDWWTAVDQGGIDIPAGFAE